MRRIAAAIVAAAWVPLVGAAQEAQPPAPPAGQPAAPAQASPPTPAQPPQAQPPPQYAPPQYPPQYAPPPQYTPPPPQYAPPPGYPPPQYAPAPQAYPPPQHPPQYPQYAPPPGAAQAARPPPFPVQPAAPQRSPWYVGFTLGGGDGNVRLPATPGQPAGTYSLHEFFGKGATTFAFDFQLGATVTPRLLVGGELTVFTAVATYDNPFGSEASKSLGISNLNAVATFFPFERGLFLRGGLGISSVSTTTDVPGVGKTSDSASGGNLALGLGYAWWIGQRFNLSANVDWSTQSFGGDAVDGTSFWRFGIGFHWF